MRVITYRVLSIQRPTTLVFGGMATSYGCNSTEKSVTESVFKPSFVCLLLLLLPFPFFPLFSLGSIEVLRSHCSTQIEHLGPSRLFYLI